MIGREDCGWRSGLMCAGVLVLGLGCQNDRLQESQAAAAAQSAAALAQDPELADPIGRTLALAAAQAAPGFTKVDKLWRGELAQRERRSFLAVLPYGHCYRFVAAGGPGVRDLDLTLIDPNNVELQRDVTEDPTPVLGKEASICPGEAGAFRVEARMRAGDGAFAIGLFRDAQ